MQAETIGSLSAKLDRWLHEEALPLWDAHGIDRNSGGFFETLFVDSNTRQIHAAGAVRRGRVVARQIFVFDAGRRSGWQSCKSDPVRHGCEFLFSRLHRSEGLFHTSIDVSSGLPDAQFSLYETAFYLFALARLYPWLGNEYPVQETALGCLAQMRRVWGKDNGGFEECSPPTLPLKSNPHMHLLEAALAWIEAAAPEERAPWIELAQELVNLCCTRFIDDAGAIREYYDAQWRPLAGDTGAIIEPGHQFEWAWLLLQWVGSPYAEVTHRTRYENAAKRLVEIGETKGVDPARGVAFNELWDDLSPKDFDARLWPQTERLKAWCAMFQRARSAGESATASLKITEAVAGLTGYFQTQPAGLWHELRLPDGTYASEPCKASSLYHIVYAIETLRQTSSIGNTDVLY